MSEKLYQEYIERICIVLTDGLGTQDFAIRTARSQLMDSTRDGSLSSVERVRLAAEFKARATEEGIIEYN